MALSRHALPFHQRPCDEPVPVAGKDVRHQQCIEINRNKGGVTFYSNLHDFPTRNREINSPLKGGRRRERYSDVLCPHPLQLAPVSRPVFPPVCSPTWLNAFSTTEIFALTGVSSHLPNGLRLSGIPSAGVIWIPAHTMLSVFFPPSARPSHPAAGKRNGRCQNSCRACRKLASLLSAPVDGCKERELGGRYRERSEECALGIRGALGGRPKRVNFLAKMSTGHT